MTIRELGPFENTGAESIVPQEGEHLIALNDADLTLILTGLIAGAYERVEELHGMPAAQNGEETRKAMKLFKDAAEQVRAIHPQHYSDAAAYEATMNVARSSITQS